MTIMRGAITNRHHFFITLNFMSTAATNSVQDSLRIDDDEGVNNLICKLTIKMVAGMLEIITFTNAVQGFEDRYKQSIRCELATADK